MKTRIPERRTLLRAIRPRVEPLECRIARSGDPLTFPIPPDFSPLRMLFGDTLPTPPDDSLSLPTPPDDFPTLPTPPDDSPPEPSDPIDFPGPPDPIDPDSPDGGGVDPPTPFPPPVDPQPGDGPSPTDPGQGPTPPSQPIPRPPEPPTLPVAAVRPADGDVLEAGTVGEISVTMAEAITREGLNPGDFLLERIPTSGKPERIFGLQRPPGWRLEAGGTRLVLLTGQPLAEGRYRLTLIRGSRFTGVGGRTIDSVPVDTVLSEFRVAAPSKPPAPVVEVPDRPPSAPAKPVPRPTPGTPSPGRPEPAPTGVTLDRAVAIGTIGPEVRDVSGTLGPSGAPSSVRLYRIELAPGHFWRLGLEVSGDHAGSPMPTRISLFDAEGRLIDSGAMTLDGSPDDPFLFAGLEPGTYFVGVSSVDDEPGNGGYDPVTGAVGVNLRSQPGGSFSLSLVADPADSPTRVVGLDLDRLDPADPVPTGFTIRFDGPVRAWGPGGATGSESSGPPVEVVDQAGRVWPATAVSYDAQTGALSMLFRDRLPRGRYEVRLPASGGLVDLAGLSPVADGMPGRVLGRFEVTTVPTARDPNDLGALLPGRAPAGEAVELRLAPGASEAVRFVVTYETQYELRLLDPSGGVSIELVGPDGPILLDPLPTGVNGTQVQLRPGVYSVRLVNLGSGPAGVSLRIRALDPPRDSVPLNGVGQGPALGMRLVSPSAGPRPSNPIEVGGSTTNPGPPATFPDAPGSAAGPIGPGVDTGSEAIAMGEAGASIPGGPTLSLDVELLGRPTLQSLRVAAVSPDGAEGLAATASIGGGPELFRSFAIGPGQSVGLPGVDHGGWGGPASGPTAWAGAEPGEGGAVVLGPQESRAPGGESAVDLLDAVLALLPPAGGPIGDDLAMLDLGVVPGPSGGVDEGAREPDPPGDREPLPISVVQALSLGVVVTWTARRWSRRRIRAGRRTGRPPGVGGPDSSIAAARDGALLDGLIRRHPGSCAGRLS
ncbi:hypothetical protein [Tautonia plasticadhaerens]|uniref:Peptidase C-terminal archaeal/bacterial domain-containing protein n=1 Tax=Tautonia plasticadhaerens TaxID=2527974 RepID=A0A518GVW4_9BACT|nr:hypothetical protein [Tautonia plasticadhaerens]QDV32735.1 hypothetical protein ElP_05750 [Tautonia plasticadhaerens]